MSVSPIDLSKFSPERRAIRKRLREESEAATARGEERANRDRPAHDALAAFDRAARAVRRIEQELARERVALRAAEEAFERSWPGSSCVCSRCEGERTRRARGGR